METAGLVYEQALNAQGYAQIGGMDEVGRGPLAGPVVACAVILPPGLQIAGVTDSKRLSPKRRALLAEQIKTAAVAYALGWADAALVDSINVLQAACFAMETAVQNLHPPPDALLVDGKLPLKLALPCTYITRGDAASHSIAAASILAKVARDAYMQEQHEAYPQYGFDAHKGYGTAKHVAALRAHGPCALHRKTFLTKIIDKEGLFE